MFCSKCGNEVSMDNVFCPKCGARIVSEKHPGEQPHQENGKGFQLRSRLGDNGKYILLTELLLCLSIYILGKVMYSIELEVLYSMDIKEYTLFENSEVMHTLFVIGYLFAAVMMITPVFLSTQWSGNHFAAAQTLPIVGICYLSFSVIKSIKVIKSVVNAQILEAAGLNVKITGNGWLFIVISVAMFCSACAAKKKILKFQACYDPDGERKRRDEELLACLEEMARDKVLSERK